MTQVTEQNLTDEFKKWDEVMVSLMGEKWHELTAWQKMCEVASLQEYRQQAPSLFGVLFGNPYSY